MPGHLTASCLDQKIVVLCKNDTPECGCSIEQIRVRRVSEPVFLSRQHIDATQSQPDRNGARDVLIHAMILPLNAFYYQQMRQTEPAQRRLLQGIRAAAQPFTQCRPASDDIVVTGVNGAMVHDAHGQTLE